MADNGTVDAVQPASGSGAEPAGRYEFLEHVGSGGMADVYRARDRELGRDLAIKLFRAEASGPHDELRREREIQLLGSLHHPGLVEVYDAGTFDDRGTMRRFIAMEFVDGRSLAHRLKGGALTRRQAADVGAQVADALAYVHARDIVHRDVKPDNILVSEDAALGFTLVAKLADFGIAQFVDGTRFTDHNSILGTASYISPEQAGGEDVGPASDIYSLGLVLLESLTGEREYTGTPLESALARLSRSPEVPDDLPEEWRGVLSAMTADDPSTRPTAHDVAVTMRDIIRSSMNESAARHSSRRPRRTQASSGPRGAAPAVVVGIAVASAVAGLAAGILLGIHICG